MKQENGKNEKLSRRTVAMKTQSILMQVALICTLATIVSAAGNSWASHMIAAAPPPADNFAVEFSNCVESIGVTLVSTEEARPLVPSEFHLVGDGGPVTPLVVRTARCDIAVAGRAPNVGSIAQIGLVIVPPDFTGDINNYTLWYNTSDAELANHLVRLGVSAQHVQNIAYGYVQGAAGSPVPFSVEIPRPGEPAFSLAGVVTRSETPSGSFVANWWQRGRSGNVKMNTNVPSIFIGSADLTLTTDSDSELGQLIGGGSTGFPILQQFNTFTAAHMAVSVVSP